MGFNRRPFLMLAGIAAAIGTPSSAMAFLNRAAETVERAKNMGKRENMRAASVSTRSRSAYTPGKIQHADPADFRAGSIQREIVQAAADKRARKALKLAAIG